MVGDNTYLLIKGEQDSATVDSLLSVDCVIVVASVCRPGTGPLTRSRANPVSGTPRYQWYIYIINVSEDNI